MSNTGPPPPSGGDNTNLGPILVGINWMVFGPATILVCLRVGTRIWITRNLGWDDFTIVLAQVINCCGMGFVMTEVFYGLGRHLRYLSPYQEQRYLMFDYLDWIQVFLTLAISKVSICQFLLRLSKFDKLRRFLQGLIAIIILSHLPLILLIIFQCNPVQKYWHKDLPGSCFRKETVEKIIISQGVISIVTDFIGAAFPMFLLWKVDIRIRSKVALCLLMGLGVFTGAACIVRTAMSWQIKSDDLTWVGVGNALARMFEINVGMMAACVPLLKPLIKYIKTRYWGEDYSERLNSDENLSKQTGWFSRLWRNRGHMRSSHGANEPESFDAYVRYTKEHHRRKRPPINTVAPSTPTAAVHAPVMAMAPGRPPSVERPKRPPKSTVRNSTVVPSNTMAAMHTPVMATMPGRPSSVESVRSVASEPSLNLPLHGVPEIPGTNRYSTTDPIQELKGIVANHSFDEEMGR